MNSNNDHLQQIIFESVSETFEAMLFTSVYQIPSPDSESNEMDMFVIQIDSLSPIEGRLTLEVPSDLGFEITKDIYSWQEDSPPSESMVKDTLAELINTIAGKLLGKAIPEDQSFELGLPETGNDVPEPGDTVVITHFEVNNHIFSLMVEGDLTNHRPPA